MFLPELILCGFHRADVARPVDEFRSNAFPTHWIAMLGSMAAFLVIVLYQFWQLMHSARSASACCRTVHRFGGS